MSTHIKLLLRGAVFAITLALASPLPVSAQTAFPETSITRKPDVIILTIKALKPGTLQAIPPVVAKDTPVEIQWQSDAAKCYTNFTSGEQAKTGSVTGLLTKSRSFIVTCFGDGSSKTVSGKLTVGNANLAVSGAKISSGLVQKYDSKGKKVTNTYIGGGVINLQATVKNIGNLTLPAGTPVEFQFNGTSMAASVKTLPALPARATQAINYPHQTGTTDATEYQIKFCAGTGTAQKCFPISGKYKFVAQ